MKKIKIYSIMSCGNENQSRVKIENDEMGQLRLSSQRRLLSESDISGET